jgi:hypothetical protein
MTRRFGRTKGFDSFAIFVMAGLVPAISIGSALRVTNRDHRHKAGDGERRKRTTFTDDSR